MPLIADQEIPIFIYIPLYPQLPSEVHAGQPEEEVQVRVKIYLGPKRLYDGDNPGSNLLACNRLEKRQVRVTLLGRAVNLDFFV